MNNKLIVIVMLLFFMPISALAAPPGGKGGVRDQVESNAARIDALEAGAALADLSCGVDQIARFDGAQWVCSDETTSAAPSFYIVERSVTVSTMPSTELTGFHDVFCSPGDEAVGGGFAAPVSHQIKVVSSHPSSTERRKWRVGIMADAGAIPGSATIYVNCFDATP